jgi:hypothetical protein
LGEEVTRGRRKLHNELEDLYFLINSVRMFKSRTGGSGKVVHRLENENAFRVLVQILVGKRLLGRFRCMWDGNIKLDLKEVE